MNLPILMYHAVEAGAPSGYGYAVPAGQFERQLDTIRWAGFETISLGQLFEGLDGKAPLPRRPIVLTFDDAYRNIHQVAWPLMRERAMTGTLFVVADHVGGSNEWDQMKGGPRLELMDAAELKEMAASGWEIGSHGCRHLELAKANESQQNDEIFRSKVVMESLLEVSPEFYAYPYGSYTESAKAILREAGYRGAVSMFSAARSVTDDHFCLRRIMPHRGDSALSFRIKLSPLYLRYVAWRDSRPKGVKNWPPINADKRQDKSFRLRRTDWRRECS
jgi:peptidoglycan/xylan/chitin deacetylase (PgdA/CDA1 family)